MDLNSDEFNISFFFLYDFQALKKKRIGKSNFYYYTVTFELGMV